MSSSDYKKKTGRKKRKVNANVSVITCHKKLFFNACVQTDSSKEGVDQGVNQNANLALKRFKHLEYDEKFRKNFRSIASQGISDAIINENFCVAELLLEHFKTYLQREEEEGQHTGLVEFPYGQILLSLFTAMKKKSSGEIEKLSENFIPKIIDLKPTISLHTSCLMRIATKTIPQHGLSFCRHVLETIAGRNELQLKNFEKVFECFSIDEIIPLISRHSDGNWILLYLRSEKISPEEFSKLYLIWLNALESSYYPRRAWLLYRTWYNTEVDVKTINLLKKLCFLCNTCPQNYHFDDEISRENFSWDVIQEVNNDKDNTKNLLEDHGFTIKNFLFLLQETPHKFVTDVLRKCMFFDHTRMKFQKRCAEIIDWYSTTIAETTGICFDVAKIIAGLTIDIPSLLPPV